eukprot:m.68198 g.68198  ORF g.68198 m.68198 type:complete len:306 (-) comp14167_c0_seq1:119-1036(-)
MSSHRLTVDEENPGIRQLPLQPLSLGAANNGAVHASVLVRDVVTNNMQIFDTAAWLKWTESEQKDVYTRRELTPAQLDYAAWKRQCMQLFPHISRADIAPKEFRRKVLKDWLGCQASIHSAEGKGCLCMTARAFTTLADVEEFGYMNKGLTAKAAEECVRKAGKGAWLIRSSNTFISCGIAKTRVFSVTQLGPARCMSFRLMEAEGYGVMLLDSRNVDMQTYTTVKELIDDDMVISTKACLVDICSDFLRPGTSPGQLLSVEQVRQYMGPEKGSSTPPTALIILIPLVLLAVVMMLVFGMQFVMY